MSLRDVVAKDDTLESMKALRNALASEIDTAEDAREVAALAGRLHQVLKDIQAMEGGVKNGDFLAGFHERRGPRGRLRSVGGGGSAGE